MSIKHQPQTLLTTSFVFFFMLFGVACSTNETANRPVTSTTNTATSTAPPAREAERRNNALVRVAHLVPGAPSVDVFLGDNKAFANAAYKQITPYMEVAKGDMKVRIRQAGQDAATPLVEDNEDFDNGKRYTIVALPTSGGRPEIEVLEDDFVAPASGKAKVRIIHAALDAGDVDVYVTGRQDALFDDISFKDDGDDYKEIDPINGALEIRQEDRNVVLVTVPNAMLEAGKLYTIFITGQTRGAARLEATVIADEFGAPVNR